MNGTVNLKLKRELYDYQKEALSRLHQMTSAVVTMEMGTGKTTVSLLFLVQQLWNRWLVSNRKTQYALIVCPKAVIRQWVVEEPSQLFVRPSLVVDMQEYTVDREQWLQSRFGEVEHDSKNKEPGIMLQNIEAAPIRCLCMSYEQLRLLHGHGSNNNIKKQKNNDKKTKSWVINKTWSALVLDEAHRLRNSGTSTLEAVLSLSVSGVRPKVVGEKRTLEHQMILALTGTPIQNRPQDMESLWKVLGPDCCRTWKCSDAEVKYHSQIEQWRHHHVLYYRRNKENMPIDHEQILLVKLPDAAIETLRQMCACTLQEHKAASPMETLLALQRVLQFCDEPRICPGHCGSVQTTKTFPGSYGHWTSTKDGRQWLPSKEWCMQIDKEPQGLKTKTLIYMIQSPQQLPSNSASSRILVFVRWTTHLWVLAAELARIPKCKVFVYHGKMTQNERLASLEGFRGPVASEKGERFVMIMTLRSGGTGLNLQHAGVIFQMSEDYNPQIREQANARILRPNSHHKDVYLYYVRTNDVLSRAISHMNHQKVLWAERFAGTEHHVTKAIETHFYAHMDKSLTTHNRQVPTTSESSSGDDEKKEKKLDYAVDNTGTLSASESQPIQHSWEWTKNLVHSIRQWVTGKLQVHHHAFQSHDVQHVVITKQHFIDSNNHILGMCSSPPIKEESHTPKSTHSSPQVVNEQKSQSHSQHPSRVSTNNTSVTNHKNHKKRKHDVI